MFNTSHLDRGTRPRRRWDDAIMDALDALSQSRRVPPPGTPAMEPDIAKIREARQYLTEAEVLILNGNDS